MTILSDKEIKEMINKKEIVVDPIINLEEQLGPSSLDLRLGNKFRVFKEGHTDLIDPKEYDDVLIKEYTLDDVNVYEYKYTTLYESDKPFVIQPGSFILASTLERVEIPDNIVARLEGRSSIGRLGLLVHVTAGYIDPGFKGNITLELSNVSKLPIKLYPGMRICQLVFTRMKENAEIPYHAKKTSKYVEERGATSSKIHKDFK